MNLCARWVLLVFAVALIGPGCGGSAQKSGSEGSAEVETTQGEETSQGLRSFDSFDPDLHLDAEWTGDLDGMIERGYIRALVVYSLGQYFLDGATQRGATYEALAEFENFLNRRLGRGTLKIHLLIIPVQRDELLPALERGLGDIAAANLTITESRLRQVDFSRPLVTGVSELVVTGPGFSDELRAIDDLAGRELYLRRSSSYWSSLERLNGDFRDRGLAPIRLIPAEEFLQDEDLLEMVNAGLLQMTVVDSHTARFWTQVFEEIQVHDDLAVRSGGEIGWAFRKESPGLAEVVNEFVRTHKQGTLTGNVVLNRYLGSTRWARNSLAGEDRARFDRSVAIFKTYGEMYDFDHLLLAALAYQESRLDQSKRSRAGAIGVMQVLPTTAADPRVGIPDITTIENNVHAGTRYLKILRDDYFSDPAIDSLNRTLFAFAAYNAGPTRVRRLREEAAAAGLDPNIWFGNVEHVAAKRIGRETVQYVSNIAKYHVAYRLASRHFEVRSDGPS